ncbi:C-type lectin-like domain-containing protein [Aureivirga marina]|uniref:hypothetical protein n=1 Tax=Aureivirga marina TaxID=1182451 RepID=UPI0018CB9CB7|nr:hypothetical protein [Aureivirga marina]
MKMNLLSTKHLKNLPKQEKLQNLCKAISTLEAIICPEWEYRYFSYQKNWSENEEFCEMRNGEGNHLLILFKDKNICINGFSSESSAKANLKKLPEIFHEFIFGEPIKTIGTTFCFWQLEKNKNWICAENLSKENDFSDELLFLLDGNAFTFKEWAEEYYEDEFEDFELRLEFVQKIYNGEKITKDLIFQINPNYKDLKQLKIDLLEIGYDFEF